LLDYTFRKRKDLLPEIGYVQLPADHLGKRYVELILQVPELDGYRGLGHMQAVRCLRYALATSDRSEDLQLV
jgi:hypothetical protein